ncbi:pyrrolo-quinoline quinone [Halalkaliarchaeum desulfuricum]|uniref:Pyrrolo-quinoline quinone n=1 Tax=Halalkaliarchaeum desulfuricum TaxID=2055893 RepID=A0A343TNG5_9EURY|nr:PQQ-binding-like beta-propeller repeat protein [Halalkaliarchaeum desulfuricum]AUX10637.1 pyrrolo-quinoline quinone [Halalkaliarchaeum desulfuricum]
MPSMRRRAVLSSAAAISIGLAGCTTARERVGDLLREPPERVVDPDWSPEPGTWAGRGYDGTNSRHNPYASPPQQVPERKWSYNLDDWTRSLVVADGTVFASTDTEVVALDAEDGTVRWRNEVHDTRGLRYVDGRLYELRPSQDNKSGELWARSLDGEEIWHTDLDGSGSLRLVHEQAGYVYVGGIGTYWTLHADTGEVVRKRDSRLDIVVSDDETLYAARGGLLTEYEATGRTLKEGWQAQISRSGDIMLRDRYIYHAKRSANTWGAGTEDPELTITHYDRNGVESGTFTVPYYGVHLASDDAGIVTGATTRHYEDGLIDAAILALTPDGDLRWDYELPSGITNPIVADETVYTCTGEIEQSMTALALDNESGERRWSWSWDGERREHGDIIKMAAAGETLYVGDGTSVIALRE